jgi:hypothetical protein
MKKRLGVLSEADRAAYVTADGVIRRSEYAAMSLKPGIGAEWYAKYGWSDVHRHDVAIADGSKRPPPRYYDKLMRRSGNVAMDGIEFARELRARKSQDENSPERLLAQEIVHTARMSTLTRGDVGDDAS